MRRSSAQYRAPAGVPERVLAGRARPPDHARDHRVQVGPEGAADTTPTAFDIGIALAYYFTVKLTAKAITKANTTTDTAKIAKAMTQVTLTEFGADFQWDSTHRITVPLAVSQILPDGSTTVGQFSRCRRCTCRGHGRASRQQPC